MPKRFFILLVLLQAGAARGQMNMPMADSGDPVPPEQLPTPQHIEGVGNVRFPIAANAKAQRWFEQGYNLLYDFWDYEADRAFEESIRADANCAMCYWGLYQAESFNHSVTKTYALASLAKAVALEGHATPRERLYIQASEAHEAAIREAGTGEPKFDHEIEILRTLVKDNPSDTNARIALSEAVNDGFDDAGEPRKGKKESLDLLQGVLKEEPQNSAANHLWIHAVEAGPHPEQALLVHVREELGVDHQDLPSPVTAAAASLVTFAVGALIPLLPYLAGFDSLAAALIFAAVAAFVGGGVVSRITDRPFLRGAGRQLALATVVAGLTFAIGMLVHSAAL